MTKDEAEAERKEIVETLSLDKRLYHHLAEVVIQANHGIAHTASVTHAEYLGALMDHCRKMGESIALNIRNSGLRLAELSKVLEGENVRDALN